MKNTDNINVTFSLPKDLKRKLQSVVGKRELSKFASQALEKAIAERTQALRADYAAAEKDEARKKSIEEWSSLDLEGWDE